MPYGKYGGMLLVDIPEPYFIWFSGKELPGGELGEYMGMMLEIKINGLEYLLEPLRKRP